MKSAEKHSGKEDICHCAACTNARLDAYKQGMTDAAKMLTSCDNKDCGNDWCISSRAIKQEILAARDNKKEI